MRFGDSVAETVSWYSHSLRPLLMPNAPSLFSNRLGVRFQAHHLQSVEATLARTGQALLGFLIHAGWRVMGPMTLGGRGGETCEAHCRLSP